MSNKFKILVLGDSNIDEYVYGSAEKLAADAPVVVFDEIRRVRSPGMAGNVAKNIQAFGVHCDLITNPNWRSVTKSRLVEEKTNHMFIRRDSKAKIERIKNIDKIQFNNYDAVICSDYSKGFLSEDDLFKISSLAKLSFLDSKKPISSFARGYDYIKINQHEYKSSKPFLTKSLENKIIETLGSHGARYRDKTYPVKEVEIKDLSGSGDTFLSALVIKYLQTGGDINESIKYANAAASITVTKKGVSVLDKEDLEKLNKEFK